LGLFLYVNFFVQRMAHRQPPKYDPVEERINVLTHGFGFLLSIVGLVLLVIKSASMGTAKHIVSFSIFGATLIFLYAASTLYHNAKNSRWRHYLNIVDHAAIYVLIAGTYTPFALVTLSQANGLVILIVIWSIALIGVFFKIFFIGRFNKLSTIMYVAMGWLVVFDIQALIANLPPWGLFWLFAGGVSYTLGAILFSIDRIKFNHAIFHIFVLGGSFCHFVTIYFFVL
jgi:hemolysin III